MKFGANKAVLFTRNNFWCKQERLISSKQIFEKTKNRDPSAIPVLYLLFIHFILNFFYSFQNFCTTHFLASFFHCIQAFMRKGEWKLTKEDRTLFGQRFDISIRFR